MRRRIASTTALCVLCAGALAGGAQTLNKRDADNFDRKLTAVLDYGARTPPPSRPLRTSITEAEINAYLKYQGAAQLPVGVVNPNISIHDATRVSGFATVDLDAVRRSKERAWSDPLGWVSGSLEVRVAGKLRASNGSGTFELESATLGGVPIPKAFLQEVVYHYTRTPESPAGFNLDQQFTFPQRIRQVDLQRGSAVIVQ